MVPLSLLLPIGAVCAWRMQDAGKLGRMLAPAFAASVILGIATPFMLGNWDAVMALAAFLACGTGALMFKHANSSGFWVTVTMSNMDIRQGIRAVGGGSTVAGVTGAAITVILHFAGII